MIKDVGRTVTETISARQIIRFIGFLCHHHDWYVEHRWQGHVKELRTVKSESLEFPIGIQATQTQARLEYADFKLEVVPFTCEVTVSYWHTLHESLPTMQCRNDISRLSQLLSCSTFSFHFIQSADHEPFVSKQDLSLIM